MKFVATLVTVAVGILGVAVQAGHDDVLTLTGNVPNCAVKCLNDAFTKNTDCKAEDAACMCKPTNYDDGYALAANCVLQACGPEAALTEVLPAVTTLCAKAIP
ncbi:hypothetical protein V8F20_006623, partial [Naviculisporaceae sp. PSN 640]